MKTLKIVISILLVMFMSSCSYRGYKAHLFKPDKSTNLVKACSKTDKLTSHDVSKTMKYYYKQKR